MWNGNRADGCGLRNYLKCNYVDVKEKMPWQVVRPPTVSDDLPDIPLCVQLYSPIS